jgi:hypothetical protein
VSSPALDVRGLCVASPAVHAFEPPTLGLPSEGSNVERFHCTCFVPDTQVSSVSGD